MRNGRYGFDLYVIRRSFFTLPLDTIGSLYSLIVTSSLLDYIDLMGRFTSSLFCLCVLSNTTF